MESSEKISGNKGGRPVKAVKKSRTLTFKCSAYERLIIQAKAKKAKSTTSEYLREIALTGKVEIKEKLFPKEILELTGTLNHLAANLNQIARKRNIGTDDLTTMERLALKWQSDELKGLAVKMKNFIS
jgi:hypothetical protein